LDILYFLRSVGQLIFKRRVRPGIPRIEIGTRLPHEAL